MNYMEQVAHLLGVELEEEFEIIICNCKGVYKFSKEHLLKKIEGKWWEVDGSIINLIKGKLEIAKLPFKPKEREIYWFMSDDCAYRCFWKNDVADYRNWKIGNCFRTEEEAETKGKEIMENIKKEYENA